MSETKGIELDFDLNDLVNPKSREVVEEGQDEKDKELNKHIEAVRSLGPVFESFNGDKLKEVFEDKDERIVVMGRVRQVMENLRTYAPQDFAHLKGVTLSDEFEGIDAEGVIHFDVKFALSIAPQEITSYSKNAQAVLTEYGKTRKDATKNRIRKETSEIASELNRGFLLPRGRELYGNIRQPAEQLAFLKNLRLLLIKLAHKLKGVPIMYGSTNDVFEDGLHISPASILNLKQDRERIDRLAEELRDGLANINNPIKLERPTEKELRGVLRKQENAYQARGEEASERNNTFLLRARSLCSDHPQFELQNISTATDQLSSHDRLRLMGNLEKFADQVVQYSNAESEKKAEISADQILEAFNAVSLSPRFTTIDRHTNTLVLGVRDLLNDSFLTSPSGREFRASLLDYIATPKSERRKVSEAKEKRQQPIFKCEGIDITASDIRRVINTYADAQSKFVENEPILSEIEDTLKVNKAKLVKNIPLPGVGRDFKTRNERTSDFTYATSEYVKGDKIRLEAGKEDRSWILKVPQSQRAVFDKYLFLRENFRLLADLEDRIGESEDGGTPVKIGKNEAKDLSLAYANLKWFSENPDNFYLLSEDRSEIIKTSDQAYSKSKNANDLFEGRQDIAILVASDKIPLKAMDISFGRAREIFDMLGEDAMKVKGVMVDRPDAQVDTEVRFHDGILYIPFFEVASGKNLKEFVKKVKTEIAQDDPRITNKDFPSPDYPPTEIQDLLFTYTTEIGSHKSSNRIKKYEELLEEAKRMSQEGVRRPEDKGAHRIVHIRTEPNAKGELGLELSQLGEGSANYVLKVPREVKDTHDAWSELSREIAEIAPYISDLEEQGKERQREIKMKFWKIQKKYNQYSTREWLTSDANNAETKQKS